MTTLARQFALQLSCALGGRRAVAAGAGLLGRRYENAHGSNSPHPPPPSPAPTARRRPIADRRQLSGPQGRRSGALQGIRLSGILLAVVIAKQAHAQAGAPDTARVDTLQRFGVTVATASPGVVDPGLQLPGEIRPDATRTAQVAAPFAGVARSVRARAGDSVRRGDVLAIVESHTLATYELRAPLDGVVVSQLLTAGETADPSTPAFVIADLHSVWAEVSVYQKHLAQVRPGQRVRITAGYDVADAEGTISYVSPVLDQTTRTATARAVLSNDDARWRPGMFVTAYVLDPVDVAVAVPTTALQRVGGQTVVFVVEGDVFRPRPVTLGRMGLTVAEITAGLASGERYAATGSYLVKAELGKGAGDAHGE